MSLATSIPHLLKQFSVVISYITHNYQFKIDCKEFVSRLKWHLVLFDPYNWTGELKIVTDTKTGDDHGAQDVPYHSRGSDIYFCRQQL